MIEDGTEHIDWSRIWQNCHYIITETSRRHLAQKSYKGTRAALIPDFTDTSSTKY